VQTSIKKRVLYDIRILAQVKIIIVVMVKPAAIFFTSA
jgi:hypothetical protein